MKKERPTGNGSFVDVEVSGTLISEHHFFSFFFLKNMFPNLEYCKEITNCTKRSKMCHTKKEDRKKEMEKKLPGVCFRL